jgi:hypothetical protein
LQKQEEKLSARFEVMLDAKIQSSKNSPSVNPTVGITAKSGEGSCNKQGGGGTILGNYEAVKKKLVLQSGSEPKDGPNLDGIGNESTGPLDVSMKAHSSEEVHIFSPISLLSFF